MITRRSLLTGLAATALIVPSAAKIVRAAEVIAPPTVDEYFWTSSWLEDVGMGVWRQKSYRFKAAKAPEILVVNAAEDAKGVAGVQLDYDPLFKPRYGGVRHPPERHRNSLGWIRGHVDVTNTDGVEIELTRDEEHALRYRQTVTILRAPSTDLFGFFEGEGAFA